MRRTSTAIAYLDGPRLARALTAGIRHLFLRRDYLNRINVFPVPDGDTGTNMAFTFKTILEAMQTHSGTSVGEVLSCVAEAAIDGARGNSGAIMAQYFEGFRQSVGNHHLLTPEGFALASVAGADASWSAMAEPVPGTLPTVLTDFGDELKKLVGEGVGDIKELLRLGYKRAGESLANTPNQLAVLKQHGVVDAGGQGFVDLLEGIWVFTDSGSMDVLDTDFHDPDKVAIAAAGDIGAHRFCTECLIEGQGLDRKVVMKAIESLDCSSLVVAGSTGRVRVHVHVNNPAEVFLACEDFGNIVQQKADDMKRQHGLLNQPGHVAIVADSGADIPLSEIERLAIHIVPVRLSFGEREFLDGVSIQPDEFYRMLEESEVAPLTSQPPSLDFRRQYSMLTSHGYEVVSVGLSEELSGTTQAARTAAARVEGGGIRVFDTRNASAGQGLLAIVAAEAAAQGMSADEIESLLSELAPMTNTLAAADDLSFAVRGGRVPRWLKRLADFLHIMPILKAKDGRLGLGGIVPGKGVNPARLGRHALKLMKADETYRVLIAHGANPEGAREVRRIILGGHGEIHSCHIAEAGPALGVHLGPGGLIVGFLPQPGILG